MGKFLLGTQQNYQSLDFYHVVERGGQGDVKIYEGASRMPKHQECTLGS